jgi:Chondroitinase B
MKRPLALAILSALLLAPMAATDAAELCVATNGNDKAAGTLDAPFGTIQRAFEQAGPGDTIFLREGTYREQISLTSKSGTEGAPITLTAYQNEKAIISGLDVLKLEWKATPQTGVYVASSDTKPLERMKSPGGKKPAGGKKSNDPFMSQLFYNGKPMLEARWPNVPKDTNGDWNFFSPDVWAVVDANGNSYGTISDTRLAATGWDVTGAQAVLNVDHQYWCWTRKVQNHSAGSKTFNYDKDLGPSVGKTDEGGGKSTFNDDRYYLFGLRQFLDEPGEWFYDVVAKQLYFYAPDGKSPATGNLEIKSRDWGFTADQDCNYLTIDGIEFFGTACKFGKYNKKCLSLVFRNNRVWQSSWNEYLKMPKGETGHKSALGTDVIYPTIEADHAQVLNNTFAYGALSALYINGFDNLIENNVFHDFCYNSSLDYAPLQISKPWPDKTRIAGRATVRHNTFCRSGGIQVQVAQADNDFYLNDLHDSFLACHGGNKDTSALYTYDVFCKGTRLHHNWVYRGYSGTPPLTWGGGEGIRGDDKTCGLTVDHNVTWDLGGPGIEIKNVDNPTPKQANRCINNTVFNHSSYNPTKGAIYICSIKNNWNSQSAVVNNLADSIYGWWFAAPLGKVKLVSNNDTDFQASRDLVNKDWNDFRPVAKASGIINQGIAIEGISPMVAGMNPDIGAYQRGDATYWIPGQRVAKASFPIVPDQAKDVPCDRDILMWRPAFQAVSHTVTFSTSQDGLNQTSAPTIQKSFEGEENVFTLPTLAAGKTYFWRVDAVMPEKSVVKGDVWSFTTTARN